jgi:hypothetical protein
MVAGNGGKMGRSNRKGQAEEEQTKSETTEEADFGADAGAGEAAGEVAEAEVSREEGTEHLRGMAIKAMRRRNSRIAHSLLESTLLGDLNSARLLVTITDPKKGGKDELKKPRHPSLGLLLAADPEWEEEQDEDDEEEEMDDGSKEPEGL